MKNNLMPPRSWRRRVQITAAIVLFWLAGVVSSPFGGYLHIRELRQRHSINLK